MLDEMGNFLSPGIKANMQDTIRTKDIPTQVKNPDLVQRRRRQIADAAVQLFIEKGFHKTTSRQSPGGRIVHRIFV